MYLGVLANIGVARRPLLHVDIAPLGKVADHELYWIFMPME